MSGGRRRSLRHVGEKQRRGKQEETPGMIIFGAIVRSPAIIAPLTHIRLNNSLRFLHPAIPKDTIKVQVSGLVLESGLFNYTRYELHGTTYMGIWLKFGYRHGTWTSLGGINRVQFGQVWHRCRGEQLSNKSMLWVFNSSRYL